MDAQRLVGVVALNLRLCREVDDVFRPNFHTFYADRVEDARDGLPKWDTVPEGGLAAGAASASADTETARSVDDSGSR